MFCGMDEGVLNDLLECSVCLERLDTSSRVLPCQHTFCLKCLKVIVESHKELRCPECRVLVEAKVEELPPNVLLMRILEGMKNSSTPRKPAGGTSAQRARAAQLQQAQQQASQHAPGTVRGSDGKPLPPHARAIHDYRSKELGDLSFKKGETIMLQKRVDPFWFHGECSGRSGLFPITYVHIVVPLPVPTALCKALYDFRMSAPDEEGCLAFDKGAIITVHRRVDENWAEGRIEDRVGIFPIAFVELNKAATALMNSPTINRPVPPLPDHARPSHSDHRHIQQQQHRYQQMSISTPTPTQSTYQNITPMAQSQPLFNQTRVAQPTALPRNLLEPQTKHLDLIHLTNTQAISGQTMVQSVAKINENIDRLRASKYENYSTPRKTEATYQNVRTHEHFPVAVANFNANNSDSSSSVNTNSIGASSSPNSSSNTSSTESAVPSLPSSPENADRNTTVIQGNTTQNSTETEQESQELNNSIGTLSLNESSTATNTSLNVSLPPNEVESQKVEQDSSSKIEPNRLDAPSSSKVQNPIRSSGPDSLLNFGLGLQAALSPSHAKEGYVSRGQREKRHSLTPSTHLNSNSSASQNRHSAEILATSLLDHMPERDRNRPEREKERERRRRRSRSNERPLPATYVALYPYKPRKPDELQLIKGEVYIVVERCRDGWYKGAAGSGGGGGLFPGNYVCALTPNTHTPHRAARDKVPSHRSLSPATSGHPVATSSQPQGAINQSSAINSQPLANQSSSSQPSSLIGLTAPDAPPRALSPNTGNNVQAQPTGSFPWAAWSDNTPKLDKSKDKPKAEKPQSTGVSLMKRLAAMKKCKSPPPAYSMDNPVFDEGPGTSAVTTAQQQPSVHVRSGSCPSQLLRALPATVDGRSASHRVRTKERPSVLPAHEHHGHATSPWHAQAQPQHKKSQSLDVTTAKRDRDRHHSQPSKERFRCIVPYPPNSEYELELKVDDIVLVHRKRGDGWYKGTLQRTGRTGLFPASFVQSCPAE